MQLQELVEWSAATSDLTSKVQWVYLHRQGGGGGEKETQIRPP